MSNKESTPEPEVTVLLRAARDGCRRSCNELFRHHEEYLLLIAKCETDPRLKQKMGDSDFVQMTFAKAASKFEDFRGSTSKEFRGWLRSILVNELNQARRTFAGAKRDAARERNLDGDSQQMGYGLEIHSPELTPRSDLMRAEKIRMVRETVNRLPPADQEVIRLRNWERLSFSQIAQQLDKSEEAVKKSWQRAIAKLDKLLQADDITGRQN